MDPMKLKLLDELLSHLSGSQGMDLKSLLDSSKQKEGSPLEEALESPKDEAMEGDDMGKQKGLSIEKVSVLGNKMPGKVGVEMPDDDKMDGSGGAHDEMTDDELKELIAQYLK